MAEDAAVYHMGPHTLRIDRKALHGTIRQTFVDKFRQGLADRGHSIERGVVLLQGGGPFHVYSTDGELLFKQEGYMHYLFGTNEEDTFGAIDVKTGQAHLFVPKLPEAYAVWMGPLKTLADYKAKYAVDHAHFSDDMAGVLAGLLEAQGVAGPKPGPLYVLKGTNTDSGRAAPGVSVEGLGERLHLHPCQVLFNTLNECRVFKTPEELAIIRYVNRVGSDAHVAMMRESQAGVMEYQLEARFLHHCYAKGGCRTCGYTPISASGPNGAVLHYGHAGAPNDRQLQAGDMMLVDMGCEYYRYTSDITCSWPVAGQFTAQHKLVYNSVLAAQQAVLGAMKPGASWPDMHTLAYRNILEGLQKGGLLSADKTVDELLAADVGALFMPHGLGHFLGIDTHDVGGYPPQGPERIQRPGYKSLRTARTLEPGMVITVEPGCYFSAALLLPAFEDPTKAPFLNRAAIEPFMTFGGVRIEDNVLVTETGAESMTHVPRTVEEIEAVMAGGPWTVPS